MPRIGDMSVPQNSRPDGPARMLGSLPCAQGALVAALLLVLGALPRIAAADGPAAAGRAVLGPEQLQGQVIQVSDAEGSARNAPEVAEAPVAAVPQETVAAPAQESRPHGAAQAPARGRGGDDRGRTMTELIGGSELARVALALLAVIGLLLVLRLWARRLGGPLAGASRPSGVVEILARYPVARSQQLMLLKLGRRVVLIHQNRTAMTTLSELRDPQEVAALLASVEAGGASKFPGLLGRFLADQRRGGAKTEEAVPAGTEVIDLTRRPAGLFAGPKRGGAR